MTKWPEASSVSPPRSIDPRASAAGAPSGRSSAWPKSRFSACPAGDRSTAGTSRRRCGRSGRGGADAAALQGGGPGRRGRRQLRGAGAPGPAGAPRAHLRRPRGAVRPPLRGVRVRARARRCSRSPPPRPPRAPPTTLALAIRLWQRAPTRPKPSELQTITTAADPARVGAEEPGGGVEAGVGDAAEQEAHDERRHAAEHEALDRPVAAHQRRDRRARRAAISTAAPAKVA